MTQQEALDLMKMGKNVYLTGPAGSGKTYVLRKYINWLRDRGVFPAVTASTGIAATHLGGRTIHSWSGIGIKNSLSERDVDAMGQKRALYGRVNKTDVLIIDEISMLGAAQCDMVDRVLRALRRSGEPFGGMQVILSGDLFQLPPVSSGGQAPAGQASFMTESHAWKQGEFGICYLESQHRHEDKSLLRLLSEMRNDAVSKDIRERLSECVCIDEDVKADLTRLYTHNVDVDALNEEKLTALSEEKHVYDMKKSGKQSLADSLAKGCLAPECLALKVGAEVMFVKNDQHGRYVNGTRGIVVDFSGEYPLVETRSGDEILADPVEWRLEEEGKVKASISQVPLRLAWAITVHKSQGMTLDGVVVDLSGAFVPGQGYVALSRVRSLSHLSILGLNEMTFSVDPRVRHIDGELQRRSENTAGHLRRVKREKLKKVQRRFVESVGGTFDKKKAKKRKRQAQADTYEKTKLLLKEGLSVEEIAEKRDVSPQTIWKHMETLLERNTPPDISHLKISKEELSLARKAFEAEGFERLKPAREYLQEKGEDIEYDTLRLARLKIQMKKP